jgi:hypothetical protein
VTKFLLRLKKSELLRERETDWSRWSHPRRRCFVDRAALRLSRASPRIAVGGVQPTAPEIDGKCRVLGGRPGPSAKPRPRLEQETIELRVHDPPRRGNTGRAAADDYHFSIAGAGHALSAALGMKEGVCSSRTLRPATCPLVRSQLQMLSPRSHVEQGAAPPRALSRCARSGGNVRGPFHVDKTRVQT